MIASALVTVGATLFGLWLSISAGVNKLGEFTFPVAYAAPMIGSEPMVPSLPGASSDLNLSYKDIWVSAPLEQLREPQLFAATATAIPFLTVIIGGIGVIVLAWRMLGARPFSGAARPLLTVLGFLCLANAILVPWLERHLVARASAILGLPTDGTQVASDQEGWIVPRSFDFLQDTVWQYLAIAVILFLIAALWRRAGRLQRDTEGLV